MKTTKLFRAVAPMLLAFVLFLSAGVAKAQYYGNPVYSQSDVPTYGTVITYSVSSDNSYITLNRYQKVDGTTFVPSAVNSSVNVVFEVKDSSGNVVYTTIRFGIAAGESQAGYATGFGVGYSGCTYRLIGVTTDERDGNGNPYFYDAVVRNAQ